MVIDAGGGTIDITVHEVQPSGTVKEIKAASGGGWGGTLVDEAFEQLIIDIIGENEYTTFKKEQTEDWLDLWRDFEVKKRNVSPDKDRMVIIKIPLSLREILERKYRNSLENESFTIEENIKVVKDKMRFQAIVFKKLFDTSLSKTIQHTENLLRDPSLRNIEAILMVGGFSESPMLQQRVKSSFLGINVIIPAEASSSIMKGALIFGHSPLSISERVLKYTYGVRMYAPFKKGEHPDSKLVMTGAGARCKNVFSKHVERNQVVKVGESQVSQRYEPVYRDQRELLFPVFASELKDPKYTDVGCECIGEMSVYLLNHDGDLSRGVEVSFTFSGTEIEVNAVDEKTGRTTTAFMNFLG